MGSTKISAAMTTAPAEMEIDDVASSLFTGKFWETQAQWLLTIAMNAGLALVFALVILLVGWIIIKIIIWLLRKAFVRAKMDEPVRNFILGVIKFFLWLILIMFILDAINIELVSMAALIAALAFAVGLAIGHFLGNFVGGIIMSYKHIKVGDYIEGGGVTGTLKEIHMTQCVLVTPDNKHVQVPNNAFATEIVTNYSALDQRRVDMTVGIAYDGDIEVTKKILHKLAKKHPLVLDEPETNIRVSELGDSSVNLIFRPWVKTADYWTVFWDMQMDIKLKLDEAGIGIPFPQIDAHVFKHEKKEKKPYVFSDSEDEDEDEDVDTKRKRKRKMKRQRRNRRKKL